MTVEMTAEVISRVDVRAWLLRARGLNEKIDALNELIERCRSRAEGGGYKSGGGGSSKGAGYESYMAMIERYETERGKAEQIRDEVFEAINGLDNHLYAAALTRYYITSQSDQSIADAMGVERHTVTRWKRLGEEMLKKNYADVP